MIALTCFQRLYGVFEYDIFINVICIYLLFTWIENFYYKNSPIDLLPLTLWGNHNAVFNLMLNESNERTKTAKRALFVSDPSRSDRDRRAR